MLIVLYQLHFVICYSMGFQNGFSDPPLPKSRRAAVFHSLRGAEVAKVTVVTIAAAVLQRKKLSGWISEEKIVRNRAKSLSDSEIGQGKHHLAIVLPAELSLKTIQIGCFKGWHHSWLKLSPVTYRGIGDQPFPWLLFEIKI